MVGACFSTRARDALEVTQEDSAAEPSSRSILHLAGRHHVGRHSREGVVGVTHSMMIVTEWVNKARFVALSKGGGTGRTWSVGGRFARQ